MINVNDKLKSENPCIFEDFEQFGLGFGLFNKNRLHLFVCPFQFLISEFIGARVVRLSQMMNPNINNISATTTPSIQ